jgi:hypothetical protein
MKNEKNIVVAPSNRTIGRSINILLKYLNVKGLIVKIKQIKTILLKF